MSFLRQFHGYKGRNIIVYPRPLFFMKSERDLFLTFVCTSAVLSLSLVVFDNLFNISDLDGIPSKIGLLPVNPFCLIFREASPKKHEIKLCGYRKKSKFVKEAVARAK